jgi:hypothetical protein
MTTTLGLGHGQHPAPSKSPFRVNWNAVAVVVALIVALLGWFRDDSRHANAVIDDNIGRITVLETQRKGDSERLERVEAKIDRLIERTK